MKTHWKLKRGVKVVYISYSLDGRLSALPSLVFDESRQKVDCLKSMRCPFLTSIQLLLQSFSSKVFNCRLTVELLPSLESNEGKAESRPSKVGLSIPPPDTNFLSSVTNFLPPYKATVDPRKIYPPPLMYRLFLEEYSWYLITWFYIFQSRWKVLDMCIRAN